MKTNFTNAVVLLTLNLAVLACSKLESNDMVFKNAVNSETLSSPVPTKQGDQNKDSGVVLIETPAGELPQGEERPADSGVIVTNPDQAETEEKAPEEIVVVEEKAPEEVVVVEEKAPKEVVVVEEKAPEEVVVVEEKAPEEVVVVEEKAPEEVVVVEEKAPEEVVVVEEKAPEAEEKNIIYAESEIPVCHLDIRFNGSGSAASIALASAARSDLISLNLDGFESLSSSEILAMRDAVESLSSSEGVQVIKDGSSFDKNAFKKDSKYLIVVDGKKAHLELSGLGKDAKVFIMNISDKHNTVCLQANGVTDSSKFFATVKGDVNHVSRMSADVNGSGSIETFLKVIGGNQTGSYFKANSMKDRKLTMITEGKNDTFAAVEANNISGGIYNIKVTGKDNSGFGINAGSVSDGQWNMEISGEDDVSLLVVVPKMSNNMVSGSLTAKSGAKLDPALSGSIDLMTLP